MFQSLPRLFSSAKKSTGLVGVPVVPNARFILQSLYGRILADSAKLLPAEAPYRVDVEATTNHRLKIVNEESDITNIENRIDAGQIEELIMQAEDELALIPKLAEWRPWEDAGREIPIEIQK